MRRFGATALLLLSSLLATTAFAQNATTSLRGVVKDPSGAVVPGATITLVNTAAGQTLTTKSKGDGEYQLLQIAPAKYTIKITAPGFGELTKSAELLVNTPATINFSLAVTASVEAVDVSAAAQTINTTDASLGGSKDNAEIQALPSEFRNVADLLSLQPGVFYLPPPDGDPTEADSRSGSVNGGRSDQGNITVDGIDDNDQVNGYAFFGVLRETMDSTEEFNVTTGNGNADEGRSSGAQVSMVTKSGTNKFHGAAYEYFRPTNTVANDFFNKQSEASLGWANRPPKEVRNIFGVDVGGPIVKDKLFFFANYEGERIAEDSEITQTTAYPSYQAGVISYTGDTLSGGTNTTTLSKANLAVLDANNGVANGYPSGCAVCNTTAYPNGPGADPNFLTYINSMPAATLATTGDLLNTGSYVFASPFPRSQNTTIARIDYTPSAKHRIFARGNLQKDVTQGTINFPAFTNSAGKLFSKQPPSYTFEDNTKGMTFGDTWTISANVVNDIRYGYIRQGNGTYGIGSGDYVDFRASDLSNLATPTAETRNFIASVPVNNIVDNLNITKGKHDIEIGVNWRLVHQNRTANTSSFSDANSNPEWLGYTSNTSTLAPDPTQSNASAEPVDSSFQEGYLFAYSNMVGSLPEVDDQYNYKLTSATSASLLADGASLSRNFKANEYEGYIQDAWHIKPNLTMTVGLRYSLLQTPWETNGQEVTPTINTDAWYKNREACALQGEYQGNCESSLTFAPAGKYYGKPGLYPENKKNIAPRFAIVYAPNNKTSIRAGVGLYYDHFGEGLINDYDTNGEAGLSTLVTNPASTYSVVTAPRFTGRNALPFNNGTPSSTQAYPYTPFTSSNSNFSISSGVDSRIKTPYTEAFDFSIERELPGGFTLETNYVGRVAKHVIQSLDIAEPVDYVDPQGGGDYFSAGAQLSKITDQNGDVFPAKVGTIPYFEDIFPFMKNYDYNGESATQAIYNNEWALNRQGLGETQSIADIDFFCYYGCPAGYQSKFWQPQYSSLYALSSIGQSYYNALQVTLHHPTSHGLQFDVDYTFSKSIDWGSGVERYGSNGDFGGAILSTWKPQLNRAVSDFDTKQLLTTNVVDQLPFGRGRALFANTKPLVDAVIGGWQLSGIFRMSSGLPFSLVEQGWNTNYDDNGLGVVTSNFKAKKFYTANGFEPDFLPNAAAINSGLPYGNPERLTYPGEAGQRNKFRGDGYIGLDTGVSKSWKVREIGAVKFTWEVYNATNTVRFDPYYLNDALTSGSLGVDSTELTVPRRMQFALRYDF